MKVNLDQHAVRAQEAELPDCYDDPSLRFIVIDDDFMIATHSERPPLRINRWNGEVTEMSDNDRRKFEYGLPM